MKIYLRLIAIIVIFIMSVSVLGSAALVDTFTIDGQTDKLTLIGTPEGAKEDDEVAIQILKAGKTSADIKASYTTLEQFSEDFVLFTQVPADKNGAYSVTVGFKNEPAGFYWIRVNGEDAKEIYYSSSAARKAILDAINENCSVENEAASVTYLKENFDLLNDRSIWMRSFDLTDPLVFSTDEDELFKSFMTMLPTVTIANLKEKLTRAAYIVELNTNTVGAIESREALALDEAYTNAYESYLSDECKASFMNKYFVGKAYKTEEEVNNAFETGVLNDWVSEILNWDSAKSIIDGFGEEIGINMTSSDGRYCIENMTTGQKSELYENILVKQSFSGVDGFVVYVNKEIQSIMTPKTSGGGSSGGGGGGGSSSGGGGGTASTAGSTSITTPIVPTEKVPEDPTKVMFKDMEGFDWAKEAVEALAEAGIVSGTGDGKYEPAREVTREEMLVMLLRAFGVEIGEEKSDFTDAAADGWYNAYLATAKNAGYINGRPDGSFGVGDSVTREDAAVMAYTITKEMGMELDTTKGEAFSDDADVAEYATDAVYALKNAGVINGKGEGVFAPKSTCTRAEAAKIIFALISE